MSVDYAFCLLDVVYWFEKAESTVLIVAVIHLWQVVHIILTLHRELPLAADQLVLAVVTVTHWAHVLS